MTTVTVISSGNGPRSRPDPSGGLLADGARVGTTQYRVRAPLALGGMGRLYEVEHEGLRRTCVLKVLHERHGARSDVADRLREEARVLASLASSVTPAVFDTGTLADGRPWFTMERLVGSDLRTEIGRFEVLSVPSAVRLGLRLLSALAVVHAHGIVHRDLKLENLFLTVRGELKILDFGVARREGVALRKTGCGIAIGTPRSMAPEQHAALETDARTDVYAAGLVLYELVTGRGPFDESNRNVHALSLAHRHRTPPAPSRRAPQPIPPAIERVILRALEKRPAARFASASEMATALERASSSAYDTDEEPTDIDVWLPPECSEVA